MKTVVLLLINLTLVGIGIAILRKPDFLTYYRGGRFWLTWLAVSIITLPDELKSAFYPPAAAYRFIGA